MGKFFQREEVFWQKHMRNYSSIAPISRIRNYSYIEYSSSSVVVEMSIRVRTPEEEKNCSQGVGNLSIKERFSTTHSLLDNPSTTYEQPINGVFHIGNIRGAFFPSAASNFSRLHFVTDSLPSLLSLRPLSPQFFYAEYCTVKCDRKSHRIVQTVWE